MQNEEVVIIHPCENCPQLDRQINWKWFEEYDYTEEDIIETIQSCYCDKLDGLRIRWHNPNGCEDYPEPSNRKKSQHNRKKRLSKRERDIKYKNHIKQLSKLQWYPSPCIYMDEIWIRGIGYVENPKPYYKRLYRGKRSKYLKKLSHKKVRRYTGDLPRKGNQSNKLFDFWWTYD